MASYNTTFPWGYILSILDKKFHAHVTTFQRMLRHGTNLNELIRSYITQADKILASTFVLQTPQWQLQSLVTTTCAAFRLHILPHFLMSACTYSDKNIYW